MGELQDLTAFDLQPVDLQQSNPGAEGHLLPVGRPGDPARALEAGKLSQPAVLQFLQVNPLRPTPGDLRSIRGDGRAGEAFGSTGQTFAERTSLDVRQVVVPFHLSVDHGPLAVRGATAVWSPGPECR
jgi:hypothetical protein